MVIAAPTIAIASAEIDRPAPSAPSRLPLDALTLTAAAYETEEARGNRRRPHRLEVAVPAGAARR